jgi:hypothetical protein
MINSDQFSNCPKADTGVETLRCDLADQLTPLLLIVWTVPIVAFSYMTLSDKYLWIPVLLALAGVFSSLLPLAITPSIALVANAATLILFIVSLERSRPKRRRAIAVVSHRP